MGKVWPETDDGWFRPYFFVDTNHRVCSWPDATANAFNTASQQAIGRYCWEILERTGKRCNACNQQASKSGAGGCTRLPLTVDHSRWLLWPDPCWITRGPIGSSMHEALLIRGVLEQTAHRRDLTATLDAIRQACGADDCEFFLLSERQDEVISYGCVGNDREAFMQASRMPLGYGYPGIITMTCEPLVTNNIQQDERFQRDAVKRQGLHAFAGVPVTDGGQTLGYLGVGWKQSSIPLTWGVELLRALQSLALNAAYRQITPSTPATTGVLRCFGPFELEYKGQRASQEIFKRRKSLDLLRHLLLARGKPLQRDMLIELLWPEAPWDTGANRLHVTLNGLRQALDTIWPGRGVLLVKHRHGCYRLDETILGPVDAFIFSDALDAARINLRQNDTQNAINNLERALPQYRGDLFADADDLEYEAPRQRFRLRYREGLRMLIELYLQKGQLEHALALLNDARERVQVEAEYHDSLAHQLALAGDTTSPLAPPSPWRNRQTSARPL